MTGANQGADVQFRLLGPIEVWIDGSRHRLGGARQEKLLAALLVNANSVLTTARLIDVLWEDNPPETAHRQIHNAIGALRRHLGPARMTIVTDGPGYRAEVAGECIDAVEFDHAVAQARQQATAGNRDAAIRTVTAALQLWRGPALAGLTGRAIETASARLAEQRSAAQELLTGFKLELGESASLIPELSEAVAVHPLRESLRYQLMLALYRSGRQSEAIAVFEQARTLLAEELGMDPGPELSRLHQQILRSDPALMPPVAAPHPPAEGPAEPSGPTLTTDPVVPVRPCFLPYDITDFTGRATEIDQLLTMTGSRAATAVIITALDGMAGAGKTTLAVRVAHLLATEFPDGQLFLDLHGHTPGQVPLDPVTALDLLLRSLGVPPEQVPDGIVPRTGRWRSALEGQRILIVLDNAQNAAQVRPLLPGTPEARVLITSRRRLAALEGTSSFSLDVLPHNEAVALFTKVAGTQRTDTEPDAVDDVVSLCGFLPLAIRIAASRFHNRPTWTIQYLARRLADSRDRLTELSTGDRSVRAAFTVSYQHLTTEQQRVFRLLGLHPGPDFDTHDAAALLGSPVTEAEGLLEDLLDVHLLVQHTASRYHFHDLIAEYARALVAETEPATEAQAATRRLVAHYVNLGSAMEELIDPGRRLVKPNPGDRTPLPDIRTSGEVKALVTAARRTFSAIIDRAWEQGLHEQAWQLSAVLGPCLLRQGYIDEALGGYERGLEAAHRSGDRDGEVTVHRSLGFAYIAIGRFADALRTLNDGLVIEQERGNLQGAGRMLVNIGIVHIRLGHYDKAAAALQTSLDSLPGDKVPRDRAAALVNLGVVQRQLGNHADAVNRFSSALDLGMTMGNRNVEALCLSNLGWAYTGLGNLDTAHDHLTRSLSLSREIGSKEYEGRSLYMLADCCQYRDDLTTALSHARQALVLAREIENRDIESHALNALGRIHYASGDLTASGDCFQHVLRLTQTTGQNFKKAIAFNGLGKIAARQGQQATALDYWHKALTVALTATLPEAEEIRRQIDCAQRDALPRCV